MKTLAFIALATASLAAAETTDSKVLVDQAVQARFGYDSNPVAQGGPATAALGNDATWFEAAGLSFAFAAPLTTPGASLKLGYAGETVRYEDDPNENYTSHRLSLVGSTTADGWKLGVDASTLFIDGDRDTLPSVAACNANSTALWRERRAQWQHRAKLLAQHDVGALRVRLTGNVLAYHYLTHVRAGRSAFADRSDLNAGADLGWKQAASSVWFVGARAGVQHQDQVPLPGGAYDYSSRYTRLVAGWEGKLGADTTLAFLAGPDFRHYYGTIDPKTFADRDHTFGWFDASLTTKLSPTLTLTAKSTRWAWLSSTGKSAYTDFNNELALAWTVSSAVTLRVSGKAHDSSYFPALRDDWQYLGGVGATWKLNARWTFTADFLDHLGRNGLDSVADRAFDRHVVTLGATLKL